jgi:hypothetical protein
MHIFLIGLLLHSSTLVDKQNIQVFCDRRSEILGAVFFSRICNISSAEHSQICALSVSNYRRVNDTLQKDSVKIVILLCSHGFCNVIKAMHVLFVAVNWVLS